jgi:peroxiredoxin
MKISRIKIIRIRSMFRRLIFPTLAAMLLGVFSSAHAQNSVTPTGATVGVAAPGFTLVDTYGKSHKLSDFAGKHVVLEWLNHDCPFVRKHYNSGNIQSLQKKYTEMGVVWLSIVSSAEGKQGHFPPDVANNLTTEKGASPTAVLIDADGSVGHMYEARTTPHMFVINPQGTLIYIGAIDDIRSTDAADIAKATNYVDQALTSSMKGEPVSVTTTQPYGCSVKY